MESKLIVAIIKGSFNKILFYLKSELLLKIKEVLPIAFKKFCEVIWEAIKEDALKCAKEALEDAEKFLSSVEGKQKEEAVLNAIMEKIKLPVLLKPFKALIRKIIKNKLEEIVKSGIEKGKEFLG